MLKRFLALLTALVVVGAVTIWSAPISVVDASPADEYSGPYFGDGNLPPGCVRNMTADPLCHHMRTDLNGLDSPQVDVLIMVPATADPERDMRITRQAIEMWEGGIDYLGTEMGLDWLSEGMDFHVTVDHFDATSEGGGEFTTYPIVDPEIVVVVTENPVGAFGIGVDPIDFTFTNENLVPCHNVQNPFDFEYWENLPGFDSHHEMRSGTYVEDCGGAGGNICFAINTALDPAPDRIDLISLFDLVAHEVGHCLTIGHVGDGAEGDWGVVPVNDIMAYDQAPADLNKCVSTLDVEAIATRMSGYLDTDGDGDVDGDDQLEVNDQQGVGDPIGEGSNPFQVQHPDDHLYASSTGEPTDCPQPDLGPLPGERTDWTPTPVGTTRAELDVTSPVDGSVSQDGAFTVEGTVDHVPLTEEPTEPHASFVDAPDDASSGMTEITRLDVAASATHVEATVTLADLWPSTTLISPTTYSVTVNGRTFDSFIRYPHDANPMTWDNSAGGYMPAGSSKWDLTASTVTFRLPRCYLAEAGMEGPYYVRSAASYGVLTNASVDDRAPALPATLGVAAPPAAACEGGTTSGVVVVGDVPETVTLEHPEGNTFNTEQSTLGLTTIFGLDPSHTFQMDVTQPSDIEFTLDWTDAAGGSDLDLYVTGAGSSGSDGATIAKPETAVVSNVVGMLDIKVEPYFVTDPIDGSTYTLTAAVIPRDGTGPAPDGDGDGVPDTSDVCREVPGEGADGCPILPTGHVRVFVDGALLGSDAVDTAYGADSFSIPVTVPAGTQELVVEWEEDGVVQATRTITVTHDPADEDDDGVPDEPGKCAGPAAAGEPDLDGDGKRDECDSDRDGDGHSNGKENAHGSDPDDPASRPSKGGTSGTAVQTL